MDSIKLHPSPCIGRIRNPLLSGRPLLLLPEGFLVRWPNRGREPQVGEVYKGETVRVPAQVRDLVHTLLFGTCPIARCDAAKQLSGNKEHRKRILLRIYSRPHIQHMLAIAERLCAEARQQLQAEGDSIPIRRLTKAAYASPLAKPTGRRTKRAKSSAKTSLSSR